MKTLPTEAEVTAAFALIERAREHMQELADAAGIPGAYVYISESGMGRPHVNIRSRKRVFVGHTGKRNLENTSFLYETFAQQIAEIGAFLKSRAT